MKKHTKKEQFTIIDIREHQKEYKIITEKDIKHINRILTEQISAIDPHKEDYYYLQYYQKRTDEKKIDIPMQMLSLRKERKNQKQQQPVEFKGTLGTVSKKIYQKQKMLLKKDCKETKGLLSTAEEVYCKLYVLEDLKKKAMQRYIVSKDFDTKRRLFVSYLIDNGIFAELYCTEKGLRLCKRIAEIIETEQKVLLLENSLTSHIFSVDNQLTDCFVENILCPYCRTVSDISSEDVLLLIKRISAINTQEFFLSKAGQILLCLLLARLSSSSNISAIEQILSVIYKEVRQNLTGLFVAKNVSGEKKSFYAWQLLSLLVVYLDEEEQKDMVGQLRDAIIETAKDTDKDNADNINLFLNVFGLDSRTVSNIYS